VKVLLDRRLDGVASPAVWVDLAPAAAQAVDALAAAGHRRIGFISAITTDGEHYADAPVGISSVNDRISGIIAGLERNRLPVDPQLLRFMAVDGPATKRVLAQMLAPDDPPTALIASDSRVALDLLAALRERGIRIPGGVSLVVFDALEWTAYVDPPLAAVTQPTYEVGRAAAQQDRRQDLPGQTTYRD
jgi:LacI family transcriptional regulator